MISPVEQQYSQWVYPKPITDLEHAIAGGYIEVGNLAHFSSLVLPDREPGFPADILIAGCGANQAAYWALTNPHCRVVGIDLSEPSLAHQGALALRHGISNLSLHKLGILDVGTLGRQFDLIVSTGVLHHLPDPDAGLAALRSVLAPRGAMSLSVYGKHRRHGVYMLQELFRTMGLGQSGEDVALAKSVLSVLPTFHPAHLTTKNSPDLEFDAGVVDMLLHAQDQSFSVPDIFAWLRRAGLKFQCWHDQAKYSLWFTVPAKAPFFDRLAGLPAEEQYAAIELLAPTMHLHAFIARHDDQSEDDYRMEFQSDRFLSFVPERRHGVTATAGQRPGEALRLDRSGLQIGIGTNEAVLFNEVDEVRTAGDIIDGIAARSQASREQIVELMRNFCFQMWETAFLTYRTPPVASTRSA